MREVDEDPEPVAGAHELPPGGREPVAVLRRRRELERHPLPEVVRTRPRDADRAKPALVPAVEVREIWSDRLGTLQMDDRRNAAVAEIVDRRRERYRQLTEARVQLVRDPHGLVMRDRIGQ